MGGVIVCDLIVGGNCVCVGPVLWGNRGCDTCMLENCCSSAGACCGGIAACHGFVPELDGPV